MGMLAEFGSFTKVLHEHCYAIHTLSIPWVERKIVRRLIEIRWRQMLRGAAGWLGQGIKPRRLALTLALGFAIGCLPVIGAPTALCAALALALRLNLPAIQAANYAALPFQLALAAPFARLGARLMQAVPAPAITAGAAAHLAVRAASLAGGALLAWLCAAIPAVVLMTAALTPMLRRIGTLAGSEADAAGV